MARKTNVTINGKDYYRLTVDLGRNTNGKRIRKQFLGISKKEAEKKRDEYLNNIKNGITNNKIYLGKCMYDWFWEVVKNDENIKISTFDRHYRTYNKYIKDSILSSSEIKKITTMDIQKYYNSLHNNGTTNTTIKMINRVLRKFLYYCIDTDIIEKNPCKKLVIPRDTVEKKNKKDIVTFNECELKKMKYANENSKIRCITLVALGTGMRLGEVLALTKSDIDYDNNFIHINKTLVTTDIFDKENNKSKTITFIDTPKTESSIRNIILTEDLKKIIETALEIKRNEIKSALKNGYKYNFEKKEFIFTSRNGEFIKRNSAEGMWTQFLNRCGIEHKKFHTLRHTYATIQYKNNVQLYTISKLLGHSNSKTTEIYAHVTNDSLKKAVNTLNIMV